MSTAPDLRWDLAHFYPADVEQWIALASSVSGQRGEPIPDALTWALTWRHLGVSHPDAVTWCRTGLPLGDLPLLAAIAQEYKITPWLLTAWTAVGVSVRPSDMALVARLRDHGWDDPALDLVHTAGGSPAAQGDTLLPRLLAVPPAAVLDGARAGLHLLAALELAEYAAGGGATEALLRQLISRRCFSADLGAEINVAITEIGHDVPPSLWATPAVPDARVLRSMRATLPQELWDAFLAEEHPVPAPVAVEDPSGGHPDAWNRHVDEWYLIDPPEDRAVQPVMAWTDAHRVDALRRYLAGYLRFLDPEDYVEMSWPPTGYLTSDGSWGYTAPDECDEHGTEWDDACEDCQTCRPAWEEPGDGVDIYEDASWSWTVQVTTYRVEDDHVDSDTDRWHVAETDVDPRTVHFV